MGTRISNITFHGVTMPEAVAVVRSFAEQRQHPMHVCTGNLDHLRIAEVDEGFAEAYEKANLVLVDGMPIVWLSRLVGEPLPERVAGSDLVWHLARLSSETGLGIFLLGGEEGSAEATARIFEHTFPRARIVGSYCPPHATFSTPDEQSRVRAVVRSSNPDILLVAFGAPKQEKWIRENLLELNVPVTIGVGGSFEMVAGARHRAPKVVQQLGLEWLWRLVQEPRRLFRRYIVDGIPFFVKIFLRTIKARLVR